MTSTYFNKLTDDEFSRFYSALKFTIACEGGYVNDPDDPGGETKWGISKAAWPKEDIKGLTPERAAEIYYEHYWLTSGADKLPSPLSTLVFDTAVLMGPGRAKQFLRESNGDIASFLALRRQHHLNRSKPKFVKGHLNRVAKLEDYATQTTEEA